MRPTLILKGCFECTAMLLPCSLVTHPVAGFPDSMSMELHAKSSIRDSTFFFRLRRQAAIDADNAARRGSGEQATSSGAAAPRSHYQNHHQEYLYG